MPRRRIPDRPSRADSTVEEPGATPQTRNADPVVDDAARSKQLPSAA